MHFNKTFFLLTILLFFVELYIGFFVRDDFIRPYVGDFLVVILIYAGLRTFLKHNKLTIAIGVLLFAYLVEIAQYFNIVEWLNLSGHRSAEVIIGTSFSWEDMLAYTLGVGLIYFLDVQGILKNRREDMVKK